MRANEMIYRVWQLTLTNICAQIVLIVINLTLRYFCHCTSKTMAQHYLAGYFFPSCYTRLFQVTLQINLFSEYQYVQLCLFILMDDLKYTSSRQKYLKRLESP